MIPNFVVNGDTGDCDNDKPDAINGDNVDFMSLSYQMRIIAGCACTGNAGNIFSATDFNTGRELRSGVTCDYCDGFAVISATVSLRPS